MSFTYIHRLVAIIRKHSHYSFQRGLWYRLWTLLPIPQFALSGQDGRPLSYKTLSWYQVIYILFRFDPLLKIEKALSWEQIRHSLAYMVQNRPKLAQSWAWNRVNFEPNLACARATSNFLADSRSFLSCVSSVEFSDVRTKSFVITWMNFKLMVSL